jgi:hypothetical protein
MTPKSRIDFSGDKALLSNSGGEGLALLSRATLANPAKFTRTGLGRVCKSEP